MAILTVVISLVFVLLLLSLLATTVMELLASLFHLRGRNLLKALHNMLATTPAGEQLFKEFQDNSLYKHLAEQYRGTSKNRPPSYIDAESFQSILFDIILNGEGVEKLKERIDTLPDEDLKNVLNQLLRDADNELEPFKNKIEKWYNDVMDRASGWYKRYCQKILLWVGLAIALIFNADTFTIYTNLESNPARAQQIALMAESYVDARPNGLEARPLDADFQQSLDNLNALIDDEINAIKSPLGLGWSNADFSGFSYYEWMAKILGYITTALAISLGAPFWFDLLRKLVNIRSSGDKP